MIGNAANDSERHPPQLVAAAVYLKAAIVAAGGSVTITRDQIEAAVDLEIDITPDGPVTIRTLHRRRPPTKDLPG